MNRQKTTRHIRKLIARATVDDVEGMAAMSLARALADEIGMSWVMALALVEPSVRVMVPTRRSKWRAALARVVALEHDVEPSWRKESSDDWRHDGARVAVAFDGARVLAEAAARRFRACEFEVVCRGAAALTQVARSVTIWQQEMWSDRGYRDPLTARIVRGHHDQTKPPKEYVCAFWETYETSCAEYLDAAFAAAMAVRRPQNREPRSRDGFFDQWVRENLHQPPSNREPVIEDFAPSVSALREVASDWDVCDLLQSADDAAHKTSSALLFKEVPLLMRCQTCEEVAAREAAARAELVEARRLLEGARAAVSVERAGLAAELAAAKAQFVALAAEVERARRINDVSGKDRFSLLEIDPS